MALKMGEASLFHSGDPPSRILKSESPDENSGTQVKLVAVLEHLDRVLAEPGRILRSDCERQPVGDVDEAFVFGDAVAHLTRQPVVKARDIRSGVVIVARTALGQSPSSSQRRCLPCTESRVGLRPRLPHSRR